MNNINIKNDNVGGDKNEGSEIQRTTSTNTRVGGLASLIIIAAIAGFIYLEVSGRIDLVPWF